MAPRVEYQKKTFSQWEHQSRSLAVMSIGTSLLLEVKLRLQVPTN
jgi:hypothetical protein